MEEQMSLFDMGGLADDGAMRDPVSGNEVPPGSMAEEVRDDVPAMLSEGEYIVPADVVRYYGVKFFEDLRSQAKSGLMDMERNGRIGGEPVPGPSMEGELTPEEMAMLAEITGMAQGGMVMDDPRMAQYNMASYAASIPNQPMRGFNEGGLQPGVANMTQEDFMNQANQGGGFQLPRSVFTTPTPTTSPDPESAFIPVVLYGPNGDTMLAISQEQYNQLLTQGYTTEVKPTPVTPQVFDDGFDGERRPDSEGSGFSLSDENREALSNDPLGFGMESLGVELPFGADTGDIARVGMIAAGPGGALAGGFIGAAIELDNLAKAKAGLIHAEAQGLADTPEFSALQAAIATAEESLSGPARFLSNVLGFGSGRNYAAEVANITPTTTAGSRTSTTRRTATVTPAERRTAQAPATSRAPTARPDRDSGSTPSGGDSAAGVEADDTARSGGSTGGTASVGATGAGAPGLAGSATGAGPEGRDAVGPMNKGGLVAKPSRKKPVAKKK